MKSDLELKTYQFTVHSVSRVIITSMILTPSIITLTSNLLSKIEHDILTYINVLISYFLSLFFSHILGKGKVNITLNSTGIHHIWNRHFLFDNENSMTIPWEKVDRMNLKHYKLFDKIEIDLTNKTRYKQFRMNLLYNNDDFKLFIKEFPHFQSKFQNLNNTF